MLTEHDLAGSPVLELGAEVRKLRKRGDDVGHQVVDGDAQRRTFAHRWSIPSSRECMSRAFIGKTLLK